MQRRGGARAGAYPPLPSRSCSLRTVTGGECAFPLPSPVRRPFSAGAEGIPADETHYLKSESRPCKDPC
ncbi:hypothetical protein GRJ2_002403300 [Grus japonensis]|uniref:Uncharacterized protein n=1 Tax=Grus japonensis TaxID=30415 RepID=A0ABC9XNV1_GRUJA